jgi:hypothetical protein
MSQNPAANTTWGLSSVGLTSSVAPGASATFTFTITAPATAGTYNFQWQMLQYNVAYFGALTTNLAISVTGSVTPPPPPPPPATAVTITTTGLPFGTKSVFYSTQFAATGGTTPYSWVVTSGALPPGLTLNANGVLSGTPTLSGTFSFGVTVRDASGGKANRNFSLSIR